LRKAESKKQRDKDFELFGKKDLTKVCDSDSRWAAGQSIRPQSFVIKVVPEVWKLQCFYGSGCETRTSREQR